MRVPVSTASLLTAMVGMFLGATIAMPNGVSAQERNPPVPQPSGAADGWVITGTGAPRSGSGTITIGPKAVGNADILDFNDGLTQPLPSRNTHVEIIGTTFHHITQGGRWTYTLQVEQPLGGGTYVQCDRPLVLLSDGGTLGRQPLPIFGNAAGASGSHATAAISANQRPGTHRLVVQLASCWVTGGTLPVIHLTLRGPADAGDRAPGTGELTMEP